MLSSSLQGTVWLRGTDKCAESGGEGRFVTSFSNVITILYVISVIYVCTFTVQLCMLICLFFQNLPIWDNSLLRTCKIDLTSRY